MASMEYAEAEGLVPTLYSTAFYPMDSLMRIKREMGEQGFRTMWVHRSKGPEFLIYEDEEFFEEDVIYTTPDYYPTKQIEESKREIIRIKNERECIQRAYNKEIVRLDKAQSRESEKIKEAQKKLRDLKGNK